MLLMPARAATVPELMGKWRWQDYTIEVSKCGGERVCAKIVAGPKNVGRTCLLRD